MKSMSIFGLILIGVCALYISDVRGDTCPAYEEWFDCGANCQTRCATLGQPCDVVHKRCPDGCYCVAGYARDGNENCIPVGYC